MTETPILSLDINNEMDIMLAHRRGMQFARFCGITLAEQTRFATAVSEICRNSLEYGEGGKISFSIINDNGLHSLQAVIKDEGKGISNLTEILERRPEHFRGRGLGIVYAKRLSDDFRIISNQKGTKVILRKFIPVKNPVINKLIIQGWIKHLQQEPAISAYEELKMRNIQLVEITEQLKENSAMIEKQMEEIKLLNEKLSGSNKRMLEFTYAISHDLKTPLNNLKLSTEFLIRNNINEEYKPYQDILARSVSRMDKTIHSLIEIIDSQNSEGLISRDLQFSELFDQACEEYVEIIDESGATIETDFSAAPGLKYIEGYLQSLFHNLLNNALKYKSAERPLHIKVFTRKVSATRIALDFSDTGSGMDMNIVGDKLFKPFSRFSNLEGKGIGLYLIKSMIEHNGGTVEVSSDKKEGTTFTFYLKPYV